MQPSTFLCDSSTWSLTAQVLAEVSVPAHLMGIYTPLLWPRPGVASGRLGAPQQALLPGNQSWGPVRPELEALETPFPKPRDPSRSLFT